MNLLGEFCPSEINYICMPKFLVLQRYCVVSNVLLCKNNKLFWKSVMKINLREVLLVTEINSYKRVLVNSSGLANWQANLTIKKAFKAYGKKLYD